MCHRRSLPNHAGWREGPVGQHAVRYLPTGSAGNVQLAAPGEVDVLGVRPGDLLRVAG
ncbi:hypothetical protein ACIA3K_23805 [Micromonospora sp. NPDC051543]|uniref:hypothetical protein n=1 Tax=Micromonospora sp. NPDC051543 TaxID=3364287 RepID=UPI0037A9E186